MLPFIFLCNTVFSRNSVTFHVYIPIFIILPLTVFAMIIALFTPPPPPPLLLREECVFILRGIMLILLSLCFARFRSPSPYRVKHGLSACLPMTNGGRRWGLWGEEEESGAQRLGCVSSSAKPRGHRQRKREAVQATN